MKIAIYLDNPEIREFSFTEKNLAELRTTLELTLPVAECALCHNEADFLAALPEAQLALVWAFKQEWFALAPKLRTISTPAAGRDYFRIAPPPNVRVLYGAFHGEIIAETVVGMILCAARGLMTSSEGWRRDLFTGRVRTVRGSTAVILGYGNIGREIGRLLETLGCRVIGLRQGSDIDTALPLADHLICALPSDTGTDNLLDARRLALLKPSAFLYNIGRGNCIDETALASALNCHALAGAFLDVFKTEPLPADSPLRRAPNTFVYPHASAIAPQYMSLYIADLAAKLNASLK